MLHTTIDCDSRLAGLPLGSGELPSEAYDRQKGSVILPCSQDFPHSSNRREALLSSLQQAEQDGGNKGSSEVAARWRLLSGWTLFGESEDECRKDRMVRPAHRTRCLVLLPMALCFIIAAAQGQVIDPHSDLICTALLPERRRSLVRSAWARIRMNVLP